MSWDFGGSSEASVSGEDLTLGCEFVEGLVPRSGVNFVMAAQAVCDARLGLGRMKQGL